VLSVDISLHGEHNFFVGLSHRISTGGVFVATHERHPIGRHVAVTLTLPERERPVRATGEVRWVRPYKESNDGPAGVGIQLSGLEPDDAAAIDAFIEQRPPILFE
jgi:uncharacterized protein (TIGR02266 family)